MSDPRGALKVKAGDQGFTLWLGMSGLADLQAKHGQDVLQRVEPPEGAPKTWVPDLAIVVDVVAISLERFHPDADRYTVDEIISENAGIVGKLMTAAFPQQKPASGNAKRPKRAA